jgi:hypothetical protein
MLEGYFKQFCKTGYPAMAGTLKTMPQTSNPFNELIRNRYSAVEV